MSIFLAISKELSLGSFLKANKTNTTKANIKNELMYLLIEVFGFIGDEL
jgi:hypothetical protein